MQVYYDKDAKRKEEINKKEQARLKKIQEMPVCYS